MKPRTSFIFYYDWLDLLEDQSFEHKGRLVDAVSKLHLTGEDLTDDLPDSVKMLFKMMKKQFERDSEKYNAVIEKRRNAGIKSGLARQEKTESKPVAIAKVAKAPKPPKAPCLFEDFYALYPRKEAKQHALKAYQKAVKQVSHETIIDGVSKYKQQIEAKQTEKQYIKQPATWLNQGCWDDDYGSTTTSSTNTYDALLARIKSVMDQDGNFEHNASTCNIHNIEKFISSDDSIVKVYYTDERGLINPKNFTIEKITKIGAYC